MNTVDVVWNEKMSCYDVGVVGGQMVSVIPMIYNHRVVIGPADDRSGYDHGWCYPTLFAAIVAVNTWDPATEPTPVGFIKQATPGMRKIPAPAAQP